MKWCLQGSGRRGGGVMLVVLLSLCAPAARAAAEEAARAQAAPAPPSREDLARAKLHYDSGAALYHAGRYAAAKEAFEESYRLSRLPDMLFNLAAVSRKLQQPAEAVRYLEQYLEQRPDAPDRDKVRGEIDELRAQIQKKKEEERMAAAKAAVEPPPAPLAAPPPRRRLPPWPALALSGGGVALLIVGIACGGAAIATAGQVNAGTTFNRDLHARGQALEGAAIAFDIVGGLALAGGAAWTTVWYLKGRRTDRAALRLAPQGAGVGVVGSF